MFFHSFFPLQNVDVTDGSEEEEILQGTDDKSLVNIWLFIFLWQIRVTPMQSLESL